MSDLLPELVVGGTGVLVAICAALYARHLARSLDRTEEQARRD